MGRKSPRTARQAVASRAPAAARATWEWWEPPLGAALASAPFLAGRLETSSPFPPELNLHPAGGLGLGVLACLALLLRILQPRLPPIQAGRWSVVMLASLPGAAFLSALTASNRGAAMLQIGVAIGFAAAGIVAADASVRGRGGRVVVALLAGGFLSATLALREYVVHARGGDPGWRVFGEFTNPNFLASYVGLMLPLVLGAALSRPQGFRASTWLLSLVLMAAVLSAALLVTGSRGGLLATGADTAVIAGGALLGRFLGGREVRIRLAAVILAIGITACGFSYTLRQREAAADGVGGLPAELCPPRTGSAAATSNRFRVLTWSSTLEMARLRPVLGWGAGGFETTFGPHAQAGFTRHAHQTYLQLLAETGTAGLAAWLLAAGVACAVGLRRLRGREAGWVAGALGGLAVHLAHGLVDSVFMVAAIGFSVWTLAGLLLGRPREGATEPCPSRRRGAPAAAAIAGLGLAACAWLLAGRVLLEQGRAEQQAGRPIQALELLRAARTMLPLDYQVADAARRALVLAGRPGEALAEGERALALAPDWPPGYAFLANLQERGLRDPEAALRILERGIARAPLDVVLLEQLARLRARHGDQESATDAYRRILAVEASPAGQVRALGEVRDWRFAMAHMQVGAAARRAGQAEEAHERDRDAACRFAERRVLVDRNPTPFIALGEGDPETEAEFRRYEEALWSRLAQDYAGRGENDLGRLCREQAAAAAESRRTLRERLVQPAPP